VPYIPPLWIRYILTIIDIQEARQPFTARATRRDAAGRSEQLDFAVARQRALVRSTWPTSRARPGRTLARRVHCPIIVSDQLDIGDVIRRLTKALESDSAPDMSDRFVWLQTVA
jgi:hypothetical protein